jgi:hypothetical protein
MEFELKLGQFPALLRELDRNQDGYVDYGEFMILMSDVQEKATKYVLCSFILCVDSFFVLILCVGFVLILCVDSLCWFCVDSLCWFCVDSLC